MTARWIGRAVEIWRVATQPMRRAWALYGGANFLMNAMASMVALCCALLVWWAVIEDVVPLVDAGIVTTEPESRVIDRDKDKRFLVQRRLCMERAAWGKVTRHFVSEGVAGLKFELTEGPLLFLAKGCHDRKREIEIPDTLPPGHYIYRTKIEFCNRLRCEDAWVQDIPVTVIGKWPVQPVGAARPMARE